MPNISEGRDAALVHACAHSIEHTGATLAHQTSDPVHNRSVLTFFGKREEVLEGALALARVTTFGIDLRSHTGAHPRMGALDVLPFVPLEDATMAEAVQLARSAGERIWSELGVPSYLYGEAAVLPQRRLLADVRRGEFEGLAKRTDRPDIGDAACHPSAGAIAIGARRVLIAFNIVLSSADLTLAKRIARTLRERSGGLRTLRALGIALGDGRVQVSCNLTDASALPLDRLVGLVRILAAHQGVSVSGCELIGLLPRAALAAVATRVFEGPASYAPAPQARNQS
ncbi:MAG: glutamate formimidoyltransferase [Candidatus Eremiobacteraeota bacterium]|nr:glutamate formimidoyltransferase [Candidatus Eremiobacteraeota bacterium]MBC5804489.1 glutamate formimidoyltransferase [Candidatus Eremiobacteraeota bacterium]